ncbi:hypothetical protein [Clostridium perfringens]|uniref:hypothetical protein n=1 Tax=Clostridium perfringens TaxID=1502 RepID=UPI00224505A0|nr:hypothetical protein [Clostridium perfringens]MCX0402868.1 hypothetical protein [Clostridium perfringens]
MIILKSKVHMLDKQIEELEKKLSDKTKETVCIIPYGLEVVKGLEEIEELNCIEIEEEENKNKSNLSITVGIEVDEEEFRKAKEKIAELNNEKIYEVITKDEYIKDYICSMGMNANIDFIKDHWNKISNGFNFVIKAGDKYYSVERFNEVIRG